MKKKISFEENKELIKEVSEKNANISKELKHQNQNIMKIWNFEDDNINLSLPHLTIFNINKSDDNILKKNGILTIEQEILNTSSDPIIIEFYELHSSEGILNIFFLKQKRIHIINFH